MKEFVEEKTKGVVKIDAFANELLNQETESIGKMIKGTIEMATLSPLRMKTLVKEYYGCDLPFNFKSMKKTHTFYESVEGRTFFKNQILLELRGWLGGSIK